MVSSHMQVGQHRSATRVPQVQLLVEQASTAGMRSAVPCEGLQALTKVTLDIVLLTHAWADINAILSDRFLVVLVRVFNSYRSV